MKQKKKKGFFLKKIEFKKFFLNPSMFFMYCLFFKGIYQNMWGSGNCSHQTNMIARMHWTKCLKAIMAIRNKFRMKECQNPLWIAFVYFKKGFLYLSVCDFWRYSRDWHKRPLFNSSCEGWCGWDCSICTFLSKALHCSTDTEYDLKFYFGIELGGLFAVKGF